MQLVLALSEGRYIGVMPEKASLFLPKSYILYDFLNKGNIYWFVMQTWRKDKYVILRILEYKTLSFKFLNGDPN